MLQAQLTFGLNRLGTAAAATIPQPPNTVTITATTKLVPLPPQTATMIRVLKVTIKQLN